MKIRIENGRVTEISKEISCDIAEGEFIGNVKIHGDIIPDVKNAAKHLMKEKNSHRILKEMVDSVAAPEI